MGLKEDAKVKLHEAYEDALKKPKLTAILYPQADFSAPLS